MTLHELHKSLESELLSTPSSLSHKRARIMFMMKEVFKKIKESNT
jgi:hypothetical protein